jgi:hypothetical protein
MSAHSGAPASGVVDRGPLDADGLLAAAEGATSLDYWGEDQSFRVGLGVLVAAIEEMEPPPAVREPARGQLLQILATRLHLADDAKRHPEILESEVRRPVVVIGLPRTGTTILYDLLAQAPDARAPRQWEVAGPWPAPEAACFESDPRIAQLDALFAQVEALPDDAPGRFKVAAFRTAASLVAKIEPAKATAFAERHAGGP